MNRNLPELLAPAGSPEALRAAVAAGADAVYFGGGGFNARMRAQNFTDEDVEAGIALCHAHGYTINHAVVAEFLDQPAHL